MTLRQDGGIDWFVDYSLVRDGYDVIGLAAHHNHDGTRNVVLPVEMTVAPADPTTICEPTFSLPRKAAQQIMNGLWQAGLRPNDGAGAIAHIESLQAHLNDLRTVAFHALKIRKPD